MTSRTLKQVIAGIVGTLAGCLCFGFFALASLSTIKAVLLYGAVGFGVLLFAGGAIAMVSGGNDE